MLKNWITRKLKDKEFFGHPSGLYVLFLTEMWERFSFYGMRALLVMYMVKYLLIDPTRAGDVWGYEFVGNWLIKGFGEGNVQAISSQIYGLYTGFVYFTPFFGGILADKYIGQYKSVYLGGILMAIGHFLMASEKMFLLALFFLVLGNGAFKPNISTQVGNLYKDGDPRRDGAFTIFYMGINLGAWFSPLVCGTLGQVVGWHWGFGAAGVGMIMGLIFYYLGSDLIHKESAAPVKADVEHPKRPLTKEEKNSVFALVVLFILNIGFWAIYEQQGNVLQLWADDRTNWSILGFNVPSSWYQSFNPMFIFIFAPILASIWRAKSKSGKKELSSVAKMGVGCFLCGMAYIVMVIAAKVIPEGERGSLMWLATTTWIFTMGELYLSPIGLSLVTKVSPKPIVSMMMGMWFLSSFFGNYLAGFIGSFYSQMSGDAFFIMLTIIGVMAGAVFFVIQKPMEKVIGKHV